MTGFSVACFNFKNLIDPEKENSAFRSYTSESCTQKLDRPADELLTMDVDPAGFQESFETLALQPCAGALSAASYSRLASDHGQNVAHMRIDPEDG